MRVQLLSGGGAHNPKEQYLTSFIINNELAVDAGALPLALARDGQLKIRHIIITHAHLDHLAGLPLMMDNIFPEMDHIIKVYAIEETVQALRQHIFNNSIWPDFTSFKNSHGVNLEFETISPFQPFKTDSLRVLPVPVKHTVPTVGLIIEDDDSAVVISSDTADTDEIWAAAHTARDLRAAFIECSYPDRLSELAARYGHLSPQQLLAQVRKIDREIKVFAYHIKPAQMQEVTQEIEELSHHNIAVAEPSHIYEF